MGKVTLGCAQPKTKASTAAMWRREAPPRSIIVESRQGRRKAYKKNLQQREDTETRDPQWRQERRDPQHDTVEDAPGLEQAHQGHHDGHDGQQHE